MAAAALLVAALLTSCAPAAAEQVESALAVATASPRPTTGATPTAAATPTTPISSTPAPDPTPTSTPVPPAPFAMNLFRDGDFVPQHTFDWCVGASIQMAHNLVRPDTRSSYADQQALWEMARDRSSNSFGGANPRGWAETLTEIGLGPYQLVSIPEYDEALRTAAAALHATQRPVGLVMWRGRHAWVMSGFESLGDPARDRAFTVTGVRVLDPLYPHGSGVWGPSPEPNSLLTPAELASQFVIREPRRWSGGLGVGYLLVLPIDPVARQQPRPPIT